MELTNIVPNSLKDYLKSEHERALQDLIIDSQNTNIIHIPMHTAPMKILNTTNVDEIKQIIVPPVNIKIHESYRIDETHIDKSGFSYYVAYNNKPFPLAHVFSDSGTLCLGDIFVPSKISIYNPMQPLETLFTNNDRVTNHGGANLILNANQCDSIDTLLQYEYDVELKSFNIHPNMNLANNDSIWRLSSYILETENNKKYAFKIMNDIYELIFTT